jgi:MFS family permease
MVPQVLSGIQLSSAGRDRVKALGWFSIALSGGAVAGQVLGGVLISADLFRTSWRPIFLINVPIGIALTIAGLRHLDPARGTKQPLDARGVLTLSAAVLLVIVPLLLGSERGWPTWSWISLALSLPALALFEYGERRSVRPLIARQVLHNPRVRAGLLAHATTTGSYFALLGVGGLGLGISANTLISGITSSMPTQYAADLSGVVATNAQLSGAFGVALAGAVYSSLSTDPQHALSVVLAGFAALSLVGALASYRLVR